MSESLPRNWTLGTISDIAEVNPSGSTVAAGDRELVTFLPMAAVEELSGKIDVSAGQTVRLVYTFEQAGALEYGCHVAGHYAAGMRGTITVS